MAIKIAREDVPEGSSELYKEAQIMAVSVLVFSFPLFNFEHSPMQMSDFLF